MKIAVDIDDVVADLTPVILTQYNDFWNDNLTVDQITEWNMEKFVKPESGNEIFRYFEDAMIYDGVDPVPGAIEGIGALRSAGHEVFFVTASTAGTMHAKLTWMRRHGFLPWTPQAMNDFVVCRKKGRILADVLLDDGLHNCEAFTRQAVVFDRPWNRHDDRFPRVKTWIDFIDFIRSVDK